MRYSRSSVCSQENLQHHSRKQQDTVICGGGRYWPFIKHSFHLGQFNERIPAGLSLLSESSCVCLQCCGPARSYSLKGFDCQGCQVFYFERPFRVDACCLGCSLMEMRIYTPQKHLVGTVYQRYASRGVWKLCQLVSTIKNYVQYSVENIFVMVCIIYRCFIVFAQYFRFSD